MLEILILIFLTRKIGVIAATKGLSAGRWKLYLVLAWIGAELFGAVIAVMIFGKDNLFSTFLIAVACAASTYFIITNYLNKLPDVVDEDDVNNIGREQ